MRLRLLIGRYDDDDTPMIAAGFNEAIWDHDPETYDNAVASVKETFDPGGRIGYEWREVWAEFDAAAIKALFAHPPLVGTIAVEPPAVLVPQPEEPQPQEIGEAPAGLSGENTDSVKGASE